MLRASKKALSSKVLTDGHDKPQVSPARKGAQASSICEGFDRSKRLDYLLPASTPNLLCNWSPVSETKISTVLEVCQEVWGSSSMMDLQAKPVFIDLGCGDGRMVLRVCRSFSNCRGFGVDLNHDLIGHAAETAKQRGLEERCEFQVGDMADVDLSQATFIFLYLPLPALSLLMKKIFPKSGLRPGAIILSADGPLPQNKTIEPLGLRRTCTQNSGIHGYLWTGSEPQENSAEPPRSESPIESILATQIKQYSLRLRRQTKLNKIHPAAPAVCNTKDKDESNPDPAHRAAVQSLREIYKNADSGFGSDQSCEQNTLDSANLQYGEVTYEGMGSLYSVMDLGPDDVFYDLGSGIAKLVLYVALRGDVANSIGIEVGHRRHTIAEKACEILEKDLADQQQNVDAKGQSVVTHNPRCSKFSVMLGDVRKKCYTDVTVAACSNVCMDAGVQNRMLDNLLRCPSLRRIVCIAPMPPSRRLKLLRTVSASCTWARISSWHIYNVLEPPARLSSSLVPAGAVPGASKTQRLQSSASSSFITRGTSQKRRTGVAIEPIDKATTKASAAGSEHEVAAATPKGDSDGHASDRNSCTSPESAAADASSSKLVKRLRGIVQEQKLAEDSDGTNLDVVDPCSNPKSASQGDSDELQCRAIEDDQRCAQDASSSHVVTSGHVPSDLKACGTPEVVAPDIELER